MLRYRADRRTLAVVAAWFVVQAVAWTHRGSLTIVLVALASALSFLGAVAAHNALHCPVFHARALNSVWRCVLTLVYGHPVSAYLPAHNLSHHQHLEEAADVMRTTKARSRWPLVNLLFFAASISGALLRTELGYLRYAWFRKSRWRNQVLLEATLLFAALGSLALLDWRRFLLFVLVPHAFAAWGIVTMNLLQHDGADGTSRDNHSRSFVGAAINWITFNNGFHAAHHHDPSEHWSVLAEVHERVVAPRTDARLIEPSFGAYLARTFVWPARRVRFDGAAVALAEPGPDRAFYRPTAPARARASRIAMDDVPPDSSPAR